MTQWEEEEGSRSGSFGDFPKIHCLPCSSIFIFLSIDSDNSTFMIKIIFTVLILVLIYAHENARLQHAYYDCVAQSIADRELMIRDVCRQFEDRLLFKESVDCEGAEKRLRMSIPMCTLFKWSVESSLARMFNDLTGSYWALLGLFLPLVGLYMFFWNQRRMQMDVFDRVGSIMKKRRKSYPQIKAEFGDQLSYK